MESADLNSKKIANIPNNTELWIESKDGKWLGLSLLQDLTNVPEIVIPIRDKKGEVVYILDVDHDKINAFDEVDEKNLSLINDLIIKII